MDYGLLFDKMQSYRDELAKVKEAARNMLSLQKEYFRNRDHLILQRCKSAEKALDDYLKEDIKKEVNQLNLFS